jgi:hypothetical protein
MPARSKKVMHAVKAVLRNGPPHVGQPSPLEDATEHVAAISLEFDRCRVHVPEQPLVLNRDSHTRILPPAVARGDPVDEIRDHLGFRAPTGFERPAAREPRLSLLETLTPHSANSPALGGVGKAVFVVTTAEKGLAKAPVEKTKGAAPL